MSERRSGSEQSTGPMDASYERYLESLTPCPECGQVDEMDNIERGPYPICAACYLADQCDDDWLDEEDYRS